MVFGRLFQNGLLLLAIVIPVFLVRLALITEQQVQRSSADLQESLAPVLNKQGMEVIFGGRYLSTEPHSVISVDMEVTLDGGPGTARLGALLQSDQGKLFSQPIPTLRTGDTLTLAFDYCSPEPTEDLAIFGTVVSLEGSGMQLIFSKVLVGIAPVLPAGRETAAGLSMRHLEIVHAD